MRIVAIKDMAAGNDTVGEVWQETKIFSSSETLFDVMKWVGTMEKRVVLTIPENDRNEFLYNQYGIGEAKYDTHRINTNPNRDAL